MSQREQVTAVPAQLVNLRTAYETQQTLSTLSGDVARLT